MPLVMYGLVFGSVVLLGLASYAPMLERVGGFYRSRMEEGRMRLEDMFMDLSLNRLALLHYGAPIGLGLLGWGLTGMWPVGLISGGVGVVIPKAVIRQVGRHRRNAFHAQLVDCLLLLSSCLRAGLSILQSFSVVAEEMPPPIGQEFGLVIKESRMGVSLDQAMSHFKERMPSDDTTLFVSAVLVARQTGGDVTAIFARLVETLRERKKIRERVKTLTFMAKMQGIVMASLPVLFSVAVYTMDKNHFRFFLTDPSGKLLLAAVAGMQFFGAYLFMRFSKSPL